MKPSTVLTSVATPAVVEGTQFYNSIKVDLDRDEAPRIDRGWDVWVDNIQLQRSQTLRLDANSLAIVLPAGLPIGVHDLFVKDPRGQARNLAHALTVVADSGPPLPNSSGGVAGTGTGGIASRIQTGSGGNTYSSSGGAPDNGGSPGAPSGGMLVNGGVAGAETGGNASNDGMLVSGGVAGAEGGGDASSGGRLASGGVAGTESGGNVASGGTPANDNMAGSSGTCTKNCASACPNGTCDPGESTCSCSADCGVEICGNNLCCVATETAASCPADCGPQCGNGTCEPSEGVCSCPSDCKPRVCGAAGSPELCDASDSSLVACYRFESSTQPGRDDSRYGNHATSTNVSLATGHDANSISLVTSSRVRVDESPSLDVLNVTIETWMRLAAFPLTRAGLFDNEGQYGFFVLQSGVLWCSVTTALGNFAAQTTTEVSPLVWAHVACTSDGANVRIFINGVQQAVTPAAAVLNTDGKTGSSIAMNNPNGDNFVGQLDDLRIWNVAQSADWICDAAYPCMP